jgi:hypothetical protein
MRRPAWPAVRTGRLWLASLSGVLVAAMLIAPGANACKRAPCGDAIAPTITIVAPADGATVSGRTVVTGTAFDDRRLKEVGVRVDDGTFERASGLEVWSFSLDTSGLTDGAHRIAARAIDRANNVTATSLWITVANETVETVDTAPPQTSIWSPSQGQTLAGTVSVTGVTVDDTAVATVEVRIDAGDYVTAVGTTSWSTSIDTTAWGDGDHSLHVRAVDTSGNAALVTETVSFANAPAPEPSPSPQPSPSPTPSPEPQPTDPKRMVTPEGATIEVAADVTTWTAQQVYDLLTPNAFQLTRIGPSLTVKVQTAYASQTSTSAGTTGDRYTSFRATIYLNPTTGGFSRNPDVTLAHEYGHAWSMYHLYLTQQKDWTPWLQERGLLNEPKLDSTYTWTKAEIIAEDYRLLFGSPAAVSGANPMNNALPDPRTIPGYRDWLSAVWGAA